MNESYWYYTPVLWAVANNVMTGKTATTFAPAANCLITDLPARDWSFIDAQMAGPTITRGDLMLMLWQKAGCPEPTIANPYIDVSPEDYYYKAVLWAHKSQISTGTSDKTFRPEMIINKAQAATFMYRAANGEPKVPASFANPFTDVVEGIYYYESALWAVFNGVMTGKTLTTFAPNDPCRQENIRDYDWSLLQEYRATWKLSANGVLRIFGKGKLTDYSWDNETVRSVQIEDGVTEVKAAPFAACSHLKKFEVVAGNSVYAADEAGALYDKGKTILLRYPTGREGNYELAATATEIPADAFTNAVLTKVAIPANVAKISAKSFAGCDQLTGFSVVAANPAFGNGVDGALLNKAGATLICCPKAYKGKYVVIDTVTAIEADAFNGCANISEVILPDGVTAIGEAAFRDCTRLTDLTLPDGVTAIEADTFSGCKNLTHLIIPQNIRYIRLDNAFASNEKLSGFYFRGSEKEWDALWKRSSEKGDFQFINENDEFVLDPPNRIWAKVRLHFTYNVTLNAGKGAVDPAKIRVTDGLAYGPLPTPVQKGYTFMGWYTQADGGKKIGEKTIAALKADQTLYAHWQEGSGLQPAPFRFDDVKDGKAFYYNAVYWAVDHKPQITNGVTPTLFKPNDTCTRAQVVTFLWRAKGQPEPKSANNPFTDVKSSDYFYKAVLWAVENGVTEGMTKTTFGPKAGCTRGQVVTFLHRAENKPAAAGKNVFVDVKAGAYYYDAVLWAVGKEITNGTDATHFSPEKTCTRGQIVTFLYRDLTK